MTDALDLSLVQPFRFSCRPGCALCCFTTPAVAPEERARLIAIAPAITLLPGEGGFTYVASHPEGGACQLLHDLRCSAHSARPFPCRTYPVSVHLGLRTQASLVLACPGVDLTPLRGGDAGRHTGPSGLEEELRTVERELARPPSVRRRERARQDFEQAVPRLELEGRWSDPDRIRDRVVSSALRNLPSAFPSSTPPALEEGVEALPFLFDPEHGRVALAGSPAGWTLLTLSPTGGGGPVLGTYPEPAWLPPFDPEAERFLAGYLRYVASRQSLVGQILLELLDEDDRTLAEALEVEVTAIASDVVTRGLVLDALHGRGAGRLDLPLVEQGIRATDAELLDRPSVGLVL